MKHLWVILSFLLLCSMATYAAIPLQRSQPEVIDGYRIQSTDTPTVSETYTIIRHAGIPPQKISPGMFSVFLSVASGIGLLASEGTDKGLRVAAFVLAVAAVGIGITGLFRKKRHKGMAVAGIALGLLLAFLSLHNIAG
ncbi:MAG: hypothetical protein EOO06_00505 [Chitinophagaceae bacterium]|nr:MAG: hypothetical protein EOO06_00505 [Chitinophagaceae bacterium]